MSETLRNYTGSKIKGGSKERAPKRRGCGCGTILFLLILLVAGYVALVTRDTYPVARCVPNGQHYYFQVNDMLEIRQDLARAAFWDIAPEAAGLQEVRAALEGDLPVPEWVARHLVGDTWYLFGNTLEGDIYAVLVTRMTHVGTLLEKGRYFVSAIAEDPAGGLRLRHLPDAGIYYAVRGRVLLVSASRSALIHALTLRPEDSMQDDLNTLGTAAGEGRHIWGQISFAKEEGLGTVFASMELTALVDEAIAGFTYSGTLRPSWRNALAPLLATATPQKLLSPPDAPIQISADFGVPLVQVWDGLSAVLATLPATESAWESASATLRALPEDVHVATTALLGTAGPAFTLSLHEFDLNAMLPLPALTLVAQTRGVDASSLLSLVPPLPENRQAWETVPYYDAETQRARIPLIGGPSLEITAGALGDGLLISTSKTVAEKILSGGAATSEVGYQGNLHIRVNPLACVDAVRSAGLLLAENALLKGHTVQSYEAAMAPWLQRAQPIASITATAGHKDGDLSGVLTVEFR